MPAATHAPLSHSAFAVQVVPFTAGAYRAIAERVWASLDRPKQVGPKIVMD